MLFRLLVAASVGASAWLAPSAAAADELIDRLLSVPGLTIVSEDETQPGFRVFALSFQQRVNHSVLSKGTFSQRLLLRHRSFTAPMVVTTEGYGLAAVPARSEPAQITDGNELRIEHRFFLPSRPEPADWRDLTIAQAAADHHRIIGALKQVYGGRWLTTGRSKGGMAAAYHRRFYPDDVDGTIVYVAPNDVIDHRDSYISFLERVGTADCRQKYLNHQVRFRR